MKIGFWNVNGWSSVNNNDNSVFRETCTRALDLDVICVAETHLFHDQTLDLQHYYFYGHNRNQLHVNARSGSGGVCLLVRKNLLENFNVFILENHTIVYYGCLSTTKYLIIVLIYAPVIYPRTVHQYMSERKNFMVSY